MMTHDPGYDGTETAMLHRVFATGLLGALLLLPQQPPNEPEESVRARRLPNGKLQSDEILKADHQKNLADAEELSRISEELKAALVKDDRYVLSLDTLKKLDQIDKLTRRLRARMKRF